jgi:hypothetical protein
MGKRAKGRSLQEFLPLNAAEKRILEAAAAGDLAVVGANRPEAESDANRVRADFLRFLALGGDDEAPVHEKGLWVRGAWITGKLNLSDAEIPGALLLEKCHFNEKPELYDTQIYGLFSLEGSFVPGLTAGGLTCKSGIELRNGFVSKGEVELSGATISNYFDCRGGIFMNSGKIAIKAPRIKVSGDVFMCNDSNLKIQFTAQGEVNLGGAVVSGNLDCSGCRFSNVDITKNVNITAIDAIHIKVGNNIFMKKCFMAEGKIRISGATVGGDLDFYKGKFEHPKGTAIECKGMTVSGTIYLHDVLSLNGKVDLRGARIARLVDDLKSWPQDIILDGFVYDSFASDAPTTAKARLAWLEKQSEKHSGKAKNPREFRPQPWQQLRKVLRETGHLEDSRQVAIAFEARKRECGVIGEIVTPAAPADIVACFRQWLRSRTARGFHFLYGALIGYGYRPARLFWILAIVWLASTVLFTIGGHSRVFGPSDPKIFENPTYAPCNPEITPRANWTRCQTFPRAYPAFYPPLYALDVLLPIAKLGQEDHWAPLAPERALTTKNWLLAWATQFVVWFGTLFGWIAGLLLIATVSGLAKRQDD